MRARGVGEAGDGEAVKAKALFRFFKSELACLSLASSVESEEGGAGEGAGAGTGWEDAPPRNGLVVDLTAGRMVVRYSMSESTVLEARVG